MCELTKEKIDIWFNEFANFMCIDKSSIPTYMLKFKEVSLDKADIQGYEAPAYTSYDVKTHTHYLCISTNIELLKYVLYHEFAHIMDTQNYAKDDITRYIGISGYTEYHASQIELAQLVGAKSINCIPAFSMKLIINTLSGNKTVYQYVKEKYDHAVELFTRSDSLSSISAIKTALGVLYNYWGLRSICKANASDYVEEINNDAFLKHISSVDFCALNNLMQGWLTEEKINMSIVIYIKVVSFLISQNK